MRLDKSYSGAHRGFNETQQALLCEIEAGAVPPISSAHKRLQCFPVPIRKGHQRRL